MKEQETTNLEFKVQEILDMKNSLESFMKREDVPILISYRVSRIAKKIFEELALFEEQRTKLVKRFGAIGDDGNYHVTTRMIEFQAELKKVLDEPVKMKFEKISLSQLKDLNFKPIDMFFLEKFFEE